MKTYWLYYDNKPLTAVRLHDGATDDEVRQKARHELEVVPGVVCDNNDDFYSHSYKINYAVIRTFASETVV